MLNKKIISIVTLSLLVFSLGLSNQSQAEESASVGTTASVGFSGEYEEKEPPKINPEDNDNPGGNTGGGGSHTGSTPRPGGTSSNGSTSRYPSSGSSGGTTHSGGSSSSNGTVLPKLGNISQAIYSSYGIILIGLMSILIYKENKNEKEIL